MALSNGFGASGPMIYLNPRSKDVHGNKTPPHFTIARKNENGEIERTNESCTNVTGRLLRPRLYTRTWNEQEVKAVSLFIRDDATAETYCLDMTYRISTRQLFNALISLETVDDIAISIYENKSGYEAMTLRQNDQLVPWKYDGRKGEIPEPEKVKFKGKEIRDYTETDNFFERELTEWADRVFGPGKAKPAPVAREDDGQEQSEQSESLGQDEQAEQTEQEQPAVAVAPAKVATAPVKPVAKPAVAAKPAVKPAAKPVAKVAAKPAAARVTDNSIEGSHVDPCDDPLF